MRTTKTDNMQSTEILLSVYTHNFIYNTQNVCSGWSSSNLVIHRHMTYACMFNVCLNLNTKKSFMPQWPVAEIGDVEHLESVCLCVHCQCNR